MSTIERVINIVREVLNIPDSQVLNAETRLVDDLNMNELQIMELVVAIEEHFDIGIEDGDIDDFKTIGNVVTHLETMRCT